MEEKEICGFLSFLGGRSLDGRALRHHCCLLVGRTPSGAAGGVTNLVATLGGVFLVGGAGLTIVTIRHFRRRRAFVRGSSITAGVVVALRGERDGTDIQPLGYPKVRFQAASGREITFETLRPPSKEA